MLTAPVAASIVAPAPLTAKLSPAPVKAAAGRHRAVAVEEQLESRRASAATGAG